MEKTEAKGVSTKRCDGYGKSLIGGRKENQDSYDIKEVAGRGLVATVCDGMGGSVGGATASGTAVEAITEYLSEERLPESGEEKVAEAVRKANDAVYQEALENATLRGMGTTATAIWIDGTAAYVAHAGDSRIYQLRNGRKIFRTMDHSRVFELVKAKKITEEEARTRHDSNIIMRALGIRPEIAVDTKKLPYKKGDRFVLCCDGVWNCMPEAELLKMLSACGSPKDVAESVAATVDDIGRKSGGQHDNLTLVVIDMKENSTFQPSLLMRMIGKIKNRK